MSILVSVEATVKYVRDRALHGTKVALLPGTGSTYLLNFSD